MDRNFETPRPHKGRGFLGEMIYFYHHSNPQVESEQKGGQRYGRGPAISSAFMPVRNRMGLNQRQKRKLAQQARSNGAK